MNKEIKILTSLFLIMLVSCASPPPKKNPVIPQEVEAECIENIQGQNYKYLAYGKGVNNNKATKHARKVALYAAMVGGGVGNCSALMNKKERRNMTFLRNFFSNYSNWSRYVKQTNEGRVDADKRVILPDGRVKLGVEVIVDIKMLREDLEVQGVITPMVDLSGMSFIAIPESEDGKDPVEMLEDDNYKFVSNTIQSKLEDRQLKSYNLENKINEYEQARASMGGAFNSGSALIASAVGADLYAEYRIQIVKDGARKKVNIPVNIYETATSQNQGSVTGNSSWSSSADISSLCQIAIDNSLDRLMQKVRAYWSKIDKEGKPMKLWIESSYTKLNDRMPNGKKIINSLYSDILIPANGVLSVDGDAKTTGNTFEGIIRVDKNIAPTRMALKIGEQIYQNFEIEADATNTGSTLKIKLE